MKKKIFQIKVVFFENFLYDYVKCDFRILEIILGKKFSQGTNKLILKTYMSRSFSFLVGTGSLRDGRF